MRTSNLQRRTVINRENPRHLARNKEKSCHVKGGSARAATSNQTRTVVCAGGDEKMGWNKEGIGGAN